VKPIDKDHFLAFTSKLRIPSKEGDESSGEQMVPLIPLPTQSYLLEEINVGIQNDIHFFVVLKGRQEGVTTYGMALDLYLCFRHDGLVLNFIGDKPLTTKVNRSLCEGFVRSLSSHPEWQQEVRVSNDEMIEFHNGSKIIWHIANTREEGGLGRSVGAAACHGTEVGRWKDEVGIGSLMSSLAEHNPNRFFLWESTAHGRNEFKRMFEESDGQGQTTQKAIFIGWWRHPWYETRMDMPSGKRQHAVYWESDPVLNREEAVWVDNVKRRYGFEIRPTQMSWWRWHLHKMKRSRLDEMYQEYPPLPEYAWKFGATTFISEMSLIERETIIKETEFPQLRFTRFDYGRGAEFNDCVPVEVDPEETYYDLVTWEDPLEGPQGPRYAIGVDPSHGADEKSDAAAIIMLLCFSDVAVQVAEFQSKNIEAYKLAWVILHLAGAYRRRPLFNAELLGGGFELVNHINLIQMNQAYGYSPILEAAFAEIEHYVWDKPDRRKRNTSVLHYKTTAESKERMFEAIRTYFHRGMLEIRSRKLLQQMRGIIWSDAGKLEEPRDNHLLMGLGMATMAFDQILQRDIGGMGQFSRKEWMKQLRVDTGVESREEWLGSLLTNWRDRMIMQAKAKADALADKQEIERKPDTWFDVRGKWGNDYGRRE